MVNFGNVNGRKRKNIQLNSRNISVIFAHLTDEHIIVPCYFRGITMAR